MGGVTHFTRAPCPKNFENSLCSARSLDWRAQPVAPIFGNEAPLSGHGKVAYRHASPRHDRIRPIVPSLSSRLLTGLSLALIAASGCDVAPLEMAKDTDELPALEALAWGDVRELEVLLAADCEASSFAVRLEPSSGDKGFELIGEPGLLSVTMSSASPLDTVLALYPVTPLGGDTPPEALMIDDDSGKAGLSALIDVALNPDPADSPRRSIAHLVLSQWAPATDAELRLTVSIDGVTLCPDEGSQ